MDADNVSVTRFQVITVASVIALVVLAHDAFASSFGPPRPLRPLSNEDSEDLCGRFGDSLERKFASNPALLVKELDELIVRVGTRRPDWVRPLRDGGRMLAGFASVHIDRSSRERASQDTDAALDLLVQKKLTEANKLLTQTKRLGFFDEDEERAVGVQEACAKVVFERAELLDRMSRSRLPD